MIEELKGKYDIKSVEEMQNLGRRIADNIKGGDVIALIGDLGVGKTEMTKSIAKSLGIKSHVTSPTFTIVKDYIGDKFRLHHFDVFRMNDSEEFLDIGGMEMLDDGSISIIEWADIIKDVLPEDTIYIKLEYAENEYSRTVTIL